ncbi:ATP-binding protein [Okeania sp. SIO3B5]|uniref:ATP-binding protein n=1 Tax=Okeania sp. SIO3B5 TaxID=2607811 RepID=UPI0025F8001D|nr:ATP-binding protein [Okeania sp. SIO3B5]
MSSTEASANSSQTWIRFSVIDTGIGINQKNIEKLFQPFIQIDSALNRQYSGTGLGLSLVKKIIELHGGKSGVTSIEGAGSNFWFELPYDYLLFKSTAL